MQRDSKVVIALLKWIFMPRWMIILIILLSLQPLLAAEQYSEYHCDNLRERIEFMRERNSSGYDIVASTASSISDGALLKEYSTHCLNPVDTVRVVRGAIPASSTAQEKDNTIRELPSFSADNAIYVGEKANAWADFYQPPRQCRQKKLTDSEFVYCAEHKAEQRAKFELSWQSEYLKTISEKQLLQESTMQVPKKTMQLETIPAITEAEQLTQHTYRQAIDEQNQEFTRYGIIMLLLIVFAGLWVWRR